MGSERLALHEPLLHHNPNNWHTCFNHCRIILPGPHATAVQGKHMGALASCPHAQKALDMGSCDKGLCSLYIEVLHTSTPCTCYLWARSCTIQRVEVISETGHHTTDTTALCKWFGAYHEPPRLTQTCTNCLTNASNQTHQDKPKSNGLLVGLHGKAHLTPFKQPTPGAKSAVCDSGLTAMCAFTY
jgi:hypothetical protein